MRYNSIVMPAPNSPDHEPDPGKVPDYFPDDLPTFAPGQIVEHRRYGYRGVVVDFDMTCHADDDWYLSNQTHPDRDQPWYHVLVHGSNATTYAAQENLAPAQDDSAVDHPLIDMFFRGFDDGRYDRNDRAWFMA